MSIYDNDVDANPPKGCSYAVPLRSDAITAETPSLKRRTISRVVNNTNTTHYVNRSNGPSYVPFRNYNEGISGNSRYNVKSVGFQLNHQTMPLLTVSAANYQRNIGYSDTYGLIKAGFDDISVLGISKNNTLVTIGYGGCLSASMTYSCIPITKTTRLFNGFVGVSTAVSTSKSAAGNAVSPVIYVYSLSDAVEGDQLEPIAILPNTASVRNGSLITYYVSPNIGLYKIINSYNGFNCMMLQCQKTNGLYAGLIILNGIETVVYDDAPTQKLFSWSGQIIQDNNGLLDVNRAENLNRYFYKTKDGAYMSYSGQDCTAMFENTTSADMSGGCDVVFCRRRNSNNKYIYFIVDKITGVISELGVETTAMLDVRGLLFEYYGINKPSYITNPSYVNYTDVNGIVGVIMSLTDGRIFKDGSIIHPNHTTGIRMPQPR